MKYLIATLTAVLCAGCSAAGPAPRAVIEMDRPFQLRVSEVAATAAGSLQVGFDGVPSDSRCPKGEQCILAGDATVRLWIQQSPGARVSHELHTAADARQVVAVAGHELRLLRLDPYPVAGQGIDTGDYVATLSLTNRPTGVADR